MAQILTQSAIKKSLWRIVALLAIIFLIQKSIFTLILQDGGLPLSEISYGFGGYIHSLTTSGAYESCNRGYCNYSTRMPVIPLLYAVISPLANTSRHACLIKNLLVSLFSAGILYVFYHYLRRGRLVLLQSTSIALLTMIVSIPVIKHCSAADYEEGIITELLVLWLIGYLITLRSFFIEESRERNIHVIVSIQLLLATIIYLTKSSMILILLLSLSLGLIVLFSNRMRGLRVITLSASLALSVSLLGLWGIHNFAHTGRLSISSTWNGENFWKGSNHTSLKIYPQISLDRVMDSKSFTLRDGATVNVQELPRGRSSFANETEWNDYYFMIANKWHQQYPQDSLIFFGKKLANFLLSTEKTSFSGAANAANISISPRDRLEYLATSIWLVFGRILQLVLLISFIRVFKKGSFGERIFLLSASVPLAAYAIPYLVGFNYERHISPFILLVAICTFFILTASPKYNAASTARNIHEHRNLGSLE